MQLAELYDVTYSHFDTYKVFTALPEHNSKHSCRILKTFLPVKNLSAHSTVLC